MDQEKMKNFFEKFFEDAKFFYVRNKVRGIKENFQQKAEMDMNDRERKKIGLLRHTGSNNKNF